MNGLEGRDAAGDVARGGVGAGLDIAEVGRMVADKGFASSLRWQLRMLALDIARSRVLTLRSSRGLQEKDA